MEGRCCIVDRISPPTPPPQHTRTHNCGRICKHTHAYTHRYSRFHSHTHKHRCTRSRALRYHLSQTHSSTSCCAETLFSARHMLVRKHLVGAFEVVDTHRTVLCVILSFQWEVPPDYDGPEIEEAVKAADAAAEASGADALTAATGSFLAAAGAASAEDAPTQRAGGRRCTIYFFRKIAVPNFYHTICSSVCLTLLSVYVKPALCGHSRRRVCYCLAYLFHRRWRRVHGSWHLQPGHRAVPRYGILCICYYAWHSGTSSELCAAVLYVFVVGFRLFTQILRVWGVSGGMTSSSRVSE